MGGLIWIIIVIAIISKVMKAQKQITGGNTGKQKTTERRNYNSQQNSYRQPVQQNNYRQPAQQNSYRQPAQQNSYRQPAQQNSYRQPASQAGYSQQSSMGANTYAMQQRQRELKQRLQQKFASASQGNSMTGRNGTAYGNYNQPASSVPRRPQDILSRATANVAENAKDELEHSMMTEPCEDVNCVHNPVELGEIDLVGSSDLMRQLSDLMIMGYQPDLSAQRDFVAEGIEMLNSYEI